MSVLGVINVVEGSTDWKNKAIAIALFFFSIFDFYYFNVRIFDFVGLLCITGSLAFFVRSFSMVKAYTQLLLFFLLLLWFFQIINNTIHFLNHDSYFDISNIKSIVGFSLCFIVFSIFLTLSIQLDRLLSAINLILLIHVSLLILQLSYYYITGNILNLIPKSESRLLSSIFRPAGLFLEPAHYCLVIFILLAAKHHIQQKIDGIFTIALLSVLLSLSLWGIVSAAFLFFYNFFGRINFKKFFYLLLSLFLVLGAVIFLYQTNKTVEMLVDLALLNRIDAIEAQKDGSAQGRLGSSPFDSETFGYVNLLGQGFTSNVRLGGANLFSMMVNNFGLLGSVLLFGFILLAVRKDARFYFFLVLLVIGTGTHAIMSTFLFWSFLAIYIRISWKAKETAL